MGPGAVRLLTSKQAPRVRWYCHLQHGRTRRKMQRQRRQNPWTRKRRIQKQRHQSLTRGRRRATACQLRNLLMIEGAAFPRKTVTLAMSVLILLRRSYAQPQKALQAMVLT